MATCNQSEVESQLSPKSSHYCWIYIDELYFWSISFVSFSTNLFKADLRDYIFLQYCVLTTRIISFLTKSIESRRCVLFQYNYGSHGHDRGEVLERRCGWRGWEKTRKTVWEGESVNHCIAPANESNTSMYHYAITWNPVALVLSCNMKVKQQ